MRPLGKRKALVITKPDKGNAIVILDCNSYIEKMESLLGDTSKFRALDNDLYKLTKSREKSLQNFLLTLKKKGVFCDSTYKKVYPNGSRPGILYGLPKIHKNGVPLRTILSAIGTVSYKLCKVFLVPLLSQFVNNKFTIKDSFSFVEELSQFNFDFVNVHMASFDVTSLFTNIPLNETIDLCVKLLFKNNSVVRGMNKHEVCKLLTLASKNNHFLFNDVLYDQIDGVAITTWPNLCLFIFVILGRNLAN